MKIGDRVQHIDSNMEGIITSIQPGKVFFITQDGFELSFSPHKLVVIGKDLEKEFLKKVHSIKDKPTKKTIKKKQAVPELDLHIEKLLLSHQHLSGAAKMEIQLQALDRFLDKMKRSHYTEAVVIHGHGKNVLKNRIIKRLKEKGYVYYDASYAKYGGGALKVRLKH